MRSTRPSAARLAAATAAAILLAGPLAHAASVVATPPQYQVSPNLNQCYLANPTDKDVPVASLELVNQLGTVLAGATNFVMAPGTIHYVTGSGGGLTFCRATGVSPKKVRLTQCVRVNTGVPCTAVTTAP